MFLDDILKRNAEYVRGRPSKPLPPPEHLRLAVVGCYDPRLDGLLAPSLGLDHGDAIVLRAAGAFVAPSGDPLRSLALAVYLFGVREVAVVGHTSCRMAAFQNAAFIEAFRGRGVKREAFGAEDLRVWAGAIPDPRTGVKLSVASILQAPFLPSDLEVAGLLLDDTTHAIEVVHRPGDRAVVTGAVPAAGVAAGVGVGAGVTAAAAASAGALPGGGTGVPAARGAGEVLEVPAVSTEGDVGAPELDVGAGPGRARETGGGPPRGTPAPEAPGSMTQELLEAVREIRGFVKAVEESPFWKHELRKVRDELGREQSPVARLAILEGFVRRAAAQSREVAASFERLKRETAGARRSLRRDDLIDLFRRRAGPR